MKPKAPAPKTPKAKLPAADFPTLPTGTRKSIPTALIDPHPHNRELTRQSCQGLAASMLKFGQIHPAIVRPHPEKPGHYQLGAGERRWIGADINGQELKCDVYDLTDAQIEGLLVIENLQRENPDPRHEATQIRRFTQTHPDATPTDIAAMLGRDESWVKRRLRLLDLIEPLHQAWTDTESPIQALSIASMELVAQLSPEQQAQFLDDFSDSYGDHDHAAVIHWIAQNSCQLKDITWLENPATFIPGCGPGCATTSAATDLFSNTEFADRRESKCAQCLNPTCFKQRSALARANAWHTTLAKAPESHYAITDKYSHPEVTLPDGATLKPKHQTEFHGWANCKKSDPDAKPFIEEKNDTVKLTWKKPPPGQTALPPAAGETSIKTAEETLRASIDRLQGKRYTLVLDELRDHVAKAGIPDLPGEITSSSVLLKLAAAFGTHIRLNYVHGYIQDLSHGATGHTDDDDQEERGHSYPPPDTDTPEPLTPEEIGLDTPRQTPWNIVHQPYHPSHLDRLWLSIRQVLSERLRDRTYTDRKSDLIKPEFIQEMREVAALTAFDFTAAYHRAATATKLPAALKHLAPITLQ